MAYLSRPFAAHSPVGFIIPCQPLLVDRPPAGSGWLHEVKHDGYRIIARKDGGRATLWTRHGKNFTDRLPKIAKAVCSLAAESALIDGEAVAVCPDGHSDFAALRTKAGSARACLVAFDLLNFNGEDLRQHPIEERRAALSPLVAGVDSVLFSDALVAQGALVFAKACELGLKGYPLMGGAVRQICGAHDVKRVALQGNMTVIENVRIGEIRRQRQIIVTNA